jgi:RNA polymerase sigma factor (sigma-70 family)
LNRNRPAKGIAMAETRILNQCQRDGLAGPRGASDAVLLGEYAACGDADSFAELVDRYGRVVLGVGKRVLGSQTDAEDVFQATFLVLARKAGQLDDKAPLGHWLYRVAFRIAMKMRIQNARRRDHEKAVAAQVEIPRAQMPVDSMAELRPVFDEELSHLPRGYRALIVLCHLEGKSHQEAARALGWKPGSVSYRMGRAREMLRDRLARRGVCVSAVLLAAFLTEAAEGAGVSVALRNKTIDAVRSVRTPAMRSKPSAAPQPVSAPPPGVSTVVPRALGLCRAVPVAGWIAIGLILTASALWIAQPWHVAGWDGLFGIHAGHSEHNRPPEPPKEH